MLLWTFVYKFLCKHIFSSLGYTLLGHTLWEVYSGTASPFSKVTTPFYNPTSNVWSSRFFHILSNPLHSLSFFSHPPGFEVICHCAWFMDSLFCLINLCIYSDANINLWCFDYCNFRVSFEILESVCPSTVFFLKTTLDILRLLHLYMNFRIHLPIYFFLSYLGFQ